MPKIMLKFHTANQSFLHGSHLAFNLITTAAGSQRASRIQTAFFSVAEPDNVLGNTNTYITVCCPTSLSLNLCAVFPKSATAQITLCLPA